MTDDLREDLHYPNRGRDQSRRTVSRRRLLAGSVAGSAAATAGCAGARGGDRTDGGANGAETVVVFNTGDATASVVDPATHEVVATPHLGLTSSFPANQYAPGVTTAPTDPLWLNVGRGVRAVAVGSLSTVATVETGSGANWQAVTPDGRHLVVSAREPVHRQFRVDADPESGTFGAVTGEIDRTPEGGRGGRDGPGPCDVTVHSDGGYAYVPDIFGDTLTVVDVEAFEIVDRVPVDPVVGDAAAPWMATASWDGRTLLVEHDEGPTGTESIWDLRDPAAPVELARLTADDGLGERPLTSEIGPDSETGYVFTPGSGDVTVVDLAAREVLDRIDVGGAAFVGTWGPDRSELYVPVQTADEVAVIDHAAGEVTARIPVGAEPYGATAAAVRPAPDAGAELLGRLAALGVDFPDAGTTYCVGNCGCGHRL
jgi:YVTN family beta-propeller protein